MHFGRQLIAQPRWGLAVMMIAYPSKGEISWWYYSPRGWRKPHYLDWNWETSRKRYGLSVLVDYSRIFLRTEKRTERKNFGFAANVDGRNITKVNSQVRKLIPGTRTQERVRGKNARMMPLLSGEPESENNGRTVSQSCFMACNCKEATRQRRRSECCCRGKKVGAFY